MKMVKKILLGMALTVAVISFVSCGKVVGGEDDAIDNSTFSKDASIDKENDTGDLIRGFKTLNTKHLDAILHITNTINKIDTPSAALKTNGVMGYIFNMAEDENKKWAFTIAGVRYNQLTGNVDAYVESFKDIDATKLESADFTGAVKAKDSPTYTDGFGFTLVPKSAVDALLTAEKGTEKENQLDVWIDVIANDGESVGRKGTAGTYTVRFFAEDPGRTKKSSNGLEYKNADVEALAEVTVLADNVNNPFVKEGEEKGKLSNMQSDIGYYYNIQKDQKLTGKWKFDAIRMEAEEIEE